MHVSFRPILSRVRRERPFHNEVFNEYIPGINSFIVKLIWVTILSLESPLKSRNMLVVSRVGYFFNTNYFL